MCEVISSHGCGIAAVVLLPKGKRIQIDGVVMPTVRPSSNGDCIPIGGGKWLWLTEGAPSSFINTGEAVNGRRVNNLSGPKVNRFLDPPEVHVMVRRSIRPGEELTMPYGASYSWELIRNT